MTVSHSSTTSIKKSQVEPPNAVALIYSCCQHDQIKLLEFEIRYIKYSLRQFIYFMVYDKKTFLIYLCLYPRTISYFNKRDMKL